MSSRYEGKARRVFSTETVHQLRVEYKGEVAAGNDARRDKMQGEGHSNNRITSIIFEHLNKCDIESHFIGQLSETEQLVKEVEIIPLKVVVRSIATGSITRRLGFEKDHVFGKPLVEFFYKNDGLNDPLIIDDHIKLLHIASDEEIRTLRGMAKNVNKVLIQLMNEMDLRLVDFKVEFGKTENGDILLVDETSPDTCHIWDKYSDMNFDKDVYRDDAGSLVDTCQTFLDRLEELK